MPDSRGPVRTRPSRASLSMSSPLWLPRPLSFAGRACGFARRHQIEVIVDAGLARTKLADAQTLGAVEPQVARMPREKLRTPSERGVRQVSGGCPLVAVVTEVVSTRRLHLSQGAVVEM